MVLFFWLLALATLVVVPLHAWRERGRGYAVFGLVILGLSLPGAIVAHHRLLSWFPPAAQLMLSAAFAYGMAAAGLHLAHLVRARLRRRTFRYAVSIPGMAFIAAGFLSGLWLLALTPVRLFCLAMGWNRALTLLEPFDLVPFAIAILSIVTSLRLEHEVVRIPLGEDSGPDEVSRLPVERYRRHTPAPLERRPLRVVQISDTHLGPWQPVITLQRRIEELMAHEPDLVLLTGDFLTMEGAGSRGALADALSPLRAMCGRSFAIFGNHDHESVHEVTSALAINGVQLLVDEEAVLDTTVGPVQIIGADYVGAGRREHIQTLLTRFPRRPDHVRLFLLHDPAGFRYVPKGDVDLTLSGHTHGGQLGLLTFGLDWTVLRRTAWPDHGLFGHGSNRLYVHRGTGFYGFPLRIGVPGEASLLELVLSGA